MMMLISQVSKIILFAIVGAITLAFALFQCIGLVRDMKQRKNSNDDDKDKK